MVLLSEVRAHNASLKSLSSGLVAIFVGGTSGIGLSTAREFVRNTNSPHVYLVGRNQTEATRIISELREINPTSQLNFVKSDVSLLKGVDEACREIKEKEQKVNLLFMTVGYLTLQGRDETVEGLDRKFAVHYYARMRFVQNLLPLLTAATQSPDPGSTLSRVVSVLDPKIGRTGGLGQLNFSDLSLKNDFTLQNCARHASTMNNFTLEHFAQTHPDTSFVHAYPSMVNTGVMRGLGSTINAVMKVAGVLLKPLMVNLGESGERHLFAATAPRFAPKAKSAGVQDVAKGGDDVKGSGSYQLNWDGESLPDSRGAATMRAEGAGKRIWTHTDEVFRKICEDGGKY